MNESKSGSVLTDGKASPLDVDGINHTCILYIVTILNCSIIILLYVNSAGVDMNTLACCLKDSPRRIFPELDPDSLRYHHMTYYFINQSN